MKLVLGSLGIAAAMIVSALAKSGGLIDPVAFDVGFYGLISAAVVVMGSGKCAAFAR